jgi:hypothetical protein
VQIRKLEADIGERHCNCAGHTTYQSTKPSQPNSVLGLGAFIAQRARLIKPKTTHQ